MVVEVTSRASSPIVAIVGRPNVGKSSLVNRLVGRRAAIVDGSPGVTRDRKELQATWRGRSLTVVDTGGWLAGADGIDAAVRRQAEVAITEADLVCFVVDTVVGITAEDEAAARIVARSGKPVVLVANKSDTAQRELEAWEFLALGLGDPMPVSALHGRGSGDLLDCILERLASFWEQGRDQLRDSSDLIGDPRAIEPGGGSESLQGTGDKIPAIAIVGRPNAGKSTLFNRLVSSERSLVHEEPGTTRDTVDTVVSTQSGVFRFVDTAGLRKRAQMASGTEYYAMVRTLQAVDQADMVLLVIDSAEGISHQDQRLAERIDAGGSAIALVANKWDLLNTERRLALQAEFDAELGFLGYAPVLRVSAVTGKGVSRIFPSITNAFEAYRRRIPTHELNRVVADIQAAHSPPGSRILYAVQGAVDPPTFTLFVSHALARTYLRYVERQLRERLALGPTPVVMRVRLRGRG